MSEPSFFDRLSMDARLLRIARMLPLEGPITPEQVDAVRATFLSYRAKTKVTNTTVARGTGLSTSVISR